MVSHASTSTWLPVTIPKCAVTGIPGSYHYLEALTCGTQARWQSLLLVVLASSGNRSHLEPRLKPKCDSSGNKSHLESRLLSSLGFQTSCISNPCHSPGLSRRVTCLSYKHWLWQTSPALEVDPYIYIMSQELTVHNYTLLCSYFLFFCHFSIP